MRREGLVTKDVGLWFIAGLGLVLSQVGCGPVMYVHEVVVKARASVSAAKTYDAAKYAPYEYYGAEAYLKQAEVRAGYADFLVSIKYGEKATKMAKKAIRIARDKIKAREDLGEPAAGSTTSPAASAAGSDPQARVVPVVVVKQRPSATRGGSKPTKVVMPGGAGGSDSEIPK